MQVLFLLLFAVVVRLIFGTFVSCEPSVQTKTITQVTQKSDSKRNLKASDLKTDVETIREEIRALIRTNRPLAPKFVRLAFHDCIGGCDGCVDMHTEPDNNGLDVPIQALTNIVARWKNDQLSRADIWALAAMVGAEMTQSQQEFRMDYVGRIDCEDTGNVCRNANGNVRPCRFDLGDAREMPGSNLLTHELLDFFSHEFGFNPQEVVALMGAHSIGTASRQNSGFDGPEGWDDTNDRLDIDYYRKLIGGGNPNNLGDLIDAPNWNQETIRNSGDIPDRVQWRRRKGNNRNQDIIGLNVDISLCRDLSGRIQTSGSVSCRFKRNNACPHAASTIFLMANYRFNENLFLRDFESVFKKTIINGYEVSQLTEVPLSSPSSLPSSLATDEPTISPTSSPSTKPSFSPSIIPSTSRVPSTLPSYNPSSLPSIPETQYPSLLPSFPPTTIPSASPSVSKIPSNTPSILPSQSNFPSGLPSIFPTENPTLRPSFPPTTIPSALPSISKVPSNTPSILPSKSNFPSFRPSLFPTKNPSTLPSLSPTSIPSSSPSFSPSTNPSKSNAPTLGCQNDRSVSFILPWNSKEKNCKSLFKNTTAPKKIKKKCEIVDQNGLSVKNYCAETCGMCTSAPSSIPSILCTDTNQKFSFSWSTTKGSCEGLFKSADTQAKINTRCKFIDQGGLAVKKYCTKTCNSCTGCQDASTKFLFSWIAPKKTNCKKMFKSLNNQNQINKKCNLVDMKGRAVKRHCFFSCDTCK